MNKVYKQDQIYAISKVTGLVQTDVKRVLDSYIARVRNKILSGEDVRFLNICYFSSTDSRFNRYKETKAYTCTVLSEELKMSRVLINRVLLEFENIIAKDLLKRSFTYSIYGLMSIGLVEYDKGVYKIRIRKSDSLANIGVRVHTLNSFKRRVEENAR